MRGSRTAGVRARMDSPPPGQHMFHHPAVIRLSWASVPSHLEPVRSFPLWHQQKAPLWREASPAPFQAPGRHFSSFVHLPQPQLALPSPIVSLSALLLFFKQTLLDPYNCFIPTFLQGPQLQFLFLGSGAGQLALRGSSAQEAACTISSL